MSEDWSLLTNSTEVERLQEEKRTRRKWEELLTAWFCVTVGVLVLDIDRGKQKTLC